MFEEQEKRPEVFSMANVVLAVVVHVLFFGVCALVAMASLAPKELVIPMDLTLVVHENLDGNEDEPPPEEKPVPQPPSPKPQPPPPKVETPPPPVKQPDALVKESEKKNEKKKDEPKKEEKKPEEPKKSAKELREERLKKMRESATVVKADKPPPKPVSNGRTGRKTLSDAEIQRLLNLGYKPGRTEQIAGDELQRCISLIYRAFYDKWEAPSYSTSLRDIILTVRFGPSGNVVNWSIKQSSGDASADSTVKKAAQLVRQVHGLSDSFLRENKEVDVRFRVKPQ